MAERRLTILKRSGNTPVLGMCERCRFKFFTPRELTYLPAEAECNLWQRFNSHQCNLGEGQARRIRKNLTQG
jgi:hypothetical protein